jgi:hypothetical protein
MTARQVAALKRALKRGPRLGKRKRGEFLKHLIHKMKGLGEHNAGNTQSS